MKATNRSLWFAILACLAMGFFARSPQFADGKGVITIALLASTLLLGSVGLWWGLRGAREQRTLWSWLAPAINAFILIAFLAFLALLFRALKGA